MTSNDFNNSANCPAEVSLEKRSLALNEANQQGYRRLKENQEIRRTVLQDKCNRERKEKIDIYTRDFLDKAMTERKMSLRPKHLRPSAEAVRHQAKTDATQRVDYETKAALDRFDTRCIEAQYQYLKSAELSEKLVQNFHRTNQENANDKGRSR